MRVVKREGRLKGRGQSIHCAIDHGSQYDRVWSSTVRALWETCPFIPLSWHREEIESMVISLF